MSTGAHSLAIVQVGSDGRRAAIDRAVAVERPVALEVNGIGYAVLMATPLDIEDLVHGFLRADRVVDRASDILSVDAHETSDGIVVRAAVSEACSERLMGRVRHRLSESSCGLCGIENLEQAMQPLPRITSVSEAGEDAIFAALAALRGHQSLNRDTGAVHAAALCGATGDIQLVREDVGRHNAFDKLIGAMMREGRGWQGGFALLSSRCSYELVEKAAIADCPMLVTISAATSLAIDRARECGLPLAVLAREDGFQWIGIDQGKAGLEG